MVFKLLERAFFTLNLYKYEIGKATVTYLGKQVGQGQVRPLKAKITAISEFPVPKTRRELCRFLGMAGYYRCICQNFSSVAVPLTALLSLLESYVRSPECQTAFDNIKALLCSEPVLPEPNFEVFKVFNKKLNRSQHNYSTIE